MKNIYIQLIVNNRFNFNTFVENVDNICKYNMVDLLLHAFGKNFSITIIRNMSCALYHAPV